MRPTRFADPSEEWNPFALLTENRRMDRVNRRFLVASATIAIPAALLMVSFSIGTNPDLVESHWVEPAEAAETPQPEYAETHSDLIHEGESQVVLTGGQSAQPVQQTSESGVQLALGSSDAGTSDTGSVATGEIAQVVGKQPESRNYRRTRSKSNSSSAKSSSPSRGFGLFEGLFGSGSKSSGESRHDANIKRGLTASTTSSNDVSWDGIPYHDVRRQSKPSSRTATNSRTTASARGATTTGRPMAQPIRRSDTPTRTRVIRGGSSQAKSSPTPVNRLSRPKLAKAPTPALSIPKPPADNSTANESLSSTSTNDRLANDKSTRRQRPVAISTKKSSKAIANIYNGSANSSADYNSDDVPDLVPRVSRRIIKADPAPSKVAAKPAKKVIAAKPAETAKPAEVAKKNTAVAKAEPKVATPKVAKAEAKPEPKAITKPSPPMVKLDQPKVAANTKPSGAYSKPVDPTTTPVPAPPAPAKATGLKPVPSAAVAHRKESTALPVKTIESPKGRFTAAPIQQPANVDRFQAVGSGLRNQAANGTHQESPYQASQPSYDPNQRTPFGAPSHRTAQLNRNGQPGRFDANVGQSRSIDPYQSNQPRDRSRLATSGQRVMPEPAAVTAGTNHLPNTAVDSLAGNSIAGNRPMDDPSHRTNRGYPVREIPGYQNNNTYNQPDSATNNGSGVANSMVTRRSSSPSQPRVGTDSFEPVPYGARNHMRGTANAKPKMSREGAHIVASELPGIRVVTHGPSEVMIRQSNEYEIRVENRGSIDAEGVLVRAHIPDWADVQGHNATRGNVDNDGKEDMGRLVWKIDHLPAGASEQMFVRLMAARSGTYNLDVDWTLVPQKSVAQVRVHEPRLQLKIEGPDSVVYGDSQTYKVRVLNPGDGVAPNVVFTLSPHSATPQSQKIGDIPAGKEAQFEVELTAQDLGELKIDGLATGDLELRSEAEKTIRVSAAKLEAVIAGPELKYQNTDAIYNLQIENLGDATSKQVTATLRIPSGVKYLGGIDGATVQRDTLTWKLAEIAPGTTREYQFKCVMGSTGSHLFAFDCKGSAAGQAAVSIETQVESIADLILEVKDPAAPAPIGSEVTYEIVVRNRGSREAKDVRAIAQFSHGIEPLRTEGQSGEVVTGQVLFDTIPSIGAGEEVRLRVVAEAERAGHHRFRTEVRSGDTVLVAEEATHYMSPRSDRVSRRSSEQTLTR